MLFNSIEYLLFFPLVFLIYWLVLRRHLRLQNLFILGVSFFFYGWWNWKFLGLIIFTTGIDYVASNFLIKSNSQNIRKWILLLSLSSNLIILCIFKYLNFFLDSANDVLQIFGAQSAFNTLSIILPLGLSFHTFQSMGYVIDVYKNKIKPEPDPIKFFAFVTFFPQLVAGPIERGATLLPQFSALRNFDLEKFKSGLRLILWGLFLKVVIADSCALNSDYIFDHYQEMSGSLLVLGAISFGFQIYCDFAGYSYIAIGSAKLLGIDLMQNFNLPYFSRSIPEFWQRWHISLSTWFRDYIYFPLGGNRGSYFFHFKNLMIVFLLSGLWHGANFTFIVWGALHGLLYLPYVAGWIKRKKMDEAFSWRDVPLSLITFSLVTLAWIFFRAKSMDQAFGYFEGIFHPSLFSYPSHLWLEKIPFYFILGLIVLEIFGLRFNGLKKFVSLPFPIRWFAYYLCIYLIVTYSNKTAVFIYFQF